MSFCKLQSTTTIPLPSYKQQLQPQSRRVFQHTPYSIPVLRPCDVYGWNNNDDPTMTSSLGALDGSCGVGSPPSYSEATTNYATHNAPRPIPPPGTFHDSLAGFVDFIVPPAIAPMDRPVPPEGSTYRLFIGQVRFETSSAELRWLLRTTCGVTAVHIESRGFGCFLVHLANPSDQLAVTLMHKRLLFDFTGVWYASTPVQTDTLQNYVNEYLQHLTRGFRLPKDTMVVEEEKMKDQGTGEYVTGPTSLEYRSDGCLTDSAGFDDTPRRQLDDI